MKREYFNRFCEAALQVDDGWRRAQRIPGGIRLPGLKDELVWEDGKVVGRHPELPGRSLEGLKALYEFDALLEGQVTGSIKLADL